MRLMLTPRQADGLRTWLNENTVCDDEHMVLDTPDAQASGEVGDLRVAVKDGGLLVAEDVLLP